MTPFARGARPFHILLLALGAMPLGCGPKAGTASSAKLDLVEVQNGFGLLLPHQVKLATAPPATAPVIKIRTLADLKNNVSSTNPLLPVSTWPTTATLPSGNPGNHFVVVECTAPLDMTSVLDGTSGSPNYGLGKGTIQVLQRSVVNPASPVTTPVPGRAFINGFTGVNGTLQQVVTLSSAGQPVAVPNSVGVGFPGTTTNFSGANKLVADTTFVFVADSDGNLNTFETFPTSIEILIKVSTGVKGANGKALLTAGTVTSTVGPDTIPPEVFVDSSVNPPMVDITPGNGAGNVSPTTTITIGFTEPVQPFYVGSFLKPNIPPLLSPSINVTSGSQASPTQITFPFTAEPLSVFDLTRFRLTPSLNFPAATPVSLPNAPVLNFVQVQVLTGAGIGFGDLIVQPGTGVPGVTAKPQNRNTLGQATSFQTGEGPGLVNAPVSPEAIYVGRNPPLGGVSVIDLNGFGQSTGDPTNNLDNILDATDVSKFPFNPNLAVSGTQGQIVPPMVIGNSTLDGGSAGAFTLTKDTSLKDQLFTPGGSITDIHIGQPLDRVFNNAPVPLGSCLGGGSNNCAGNGFHFNTIGLPALGNSIDLAPVPNPPRLFLNPFKNCLSPQILGEDPIAITSLATNVLDPGDAFGVVGGLPPTGLPWQGLLVPNFTGPSPEQTSPASCPPFFNRQQIGHFLYVVDATTQKLLILNSNRMSLIQSIDLPDPRKIGFRADLKMIGVTNFSTGTVSFIGTDPVGSDFHQVIAEVKVGKGPLGISCQPENEDWFVCNSLDNTVSVINCSSLTVRKTLNSNINKPIDAVLTPRQTATLGFGDGVYFGFILNGDGTVAVFESGPDSGPGAFGFDNTIGIISDSFPNPVGIHVAYENGTPAAFVLHSAPQGGAQVSLIRETSSPGLQVLNPAAPGFTNFFNPGFRDREFKVVGTISSLDLAGQSPSDFAQDDAFNIGGLPTVGSVFTTIPNALQNGKSYVRLVGGVAQVIVSQPTFYFVAFQDVGRVNVIQASTLKAFQPGPANPSGGDNLPAGQQQFDGKKGISAPGCAVLSHYWRQ